MAGIELTTSPGKTFVMVVKDPNNNYATLASGIAMTEITTGRYRATYAGTGVVWVQATAGATVAVGFADFSLPQDNGYAEVVEAIKKTSVTVLPVIAVERERQKSNTIPLFVGEQAATNVVVKSSNGAAVDLTGKTLSLKIETQQKSAVASIAIAATGSSFTFTPTVPVTSVARTLDWALWDLTAKAVISHGTILVGYVPIM